MRKVLLTGLGAVAFLCAVQRVDAAAIAIDTASDAAYGDGWQPGDNGGSGWGGGWTFRNQTNVILATTNGSRGWFIGNSINNNSGGTDSNGDGDINTPTNKAFGVYSNATDQVYA